jgi:hypothetical protein
MSGILGFGLERGLDDFLSQFARNPPRTWASASVLGHSSQSLSLKTPTPKDDGRARKLQFPRDGRIGFPFHGSQANESATDQLLRRLGRLNPRQQSSVIFGSDMQNVWKVKHPPILGNPSLL